MGVLDAVFLDCTLLLSDSTRSGHLWSTGRPIPKIKPVAIDTLTQLFDTSQAFVIIPRQYSTEHSNKCFIFI